MTGRLCILSCRNFNKEIGAIIATEEWDDVATCAFSSCCGRPPITWDEVRALLSEDIEQLVVLGSVCLKNLCKPPADFPPTHVVHVEQCFHLVADRHLVDDIISIGGYLVTPGWLADWRGQLQKMGFDREQAADFFQEFANKLVLLDTGIDSQSTLHLGELGKAVNLPTRQIAVGLDHPRRLLNDLVLKWRLERERQAAREQQRRLVSELADHVSAMDVLTRLTRTQHEDEAIAVIDELFQMLFAPAALYYLKVIHNVPVPHASMPPELFAALSGLRDNYAWTADGQGLLLRIGHGNDLLGLVAVDRFTFPEYRERYLNMAISVTGICGLAIDNARNHKRLLEEEKMASLGILVAGVAHEINTPLGVTLAATTVLQDQSQQLARHFGEHSMTKSELESYLASAKTSTGLIRQNIERIGHLIHDFRQLAIERAPAQNKLFRLRQCLEDVIRSLDKHLPADRITVAIHCDPELTVEGLVGTWTTILINLINNSIKHGFKGRDQGSIDIAITSDKKWLRVAYHDDGVGLTSGVMAGIFDPFFTTDLQHNTGLGMHLVYNLVTHRLGGHIYCESQPGEGMTIKIEVPR
jgi:signal transduction histidine kinase